MTALAARPAVSASTQVLRPFRHLSWHSAAAGTLAAILPGLAVVILLALEHGQPLAAVGLGSLAAAHIASGALLMLRTRIVLDRDCLVATLLTVRPRRIMRGRVRKAVLRTVMTSDGLDTRDHLFLLDAQGTAVFRLSDRWWRRDDLTAIAMHFQVPIETVPEAMNRAELRRLPPRELLRHERSPFLASLVIATAVVADSALSAALAVIALG